MFNSLNVGDKFRKDFFKNGRRRSNIICIKTSEFEYVEQKSKEKYTIVHSANFEVRSFDLQIRKPLHSWLES